MRGDAGHGHALAAAHLTRGQRYVEDAGGQVGVVFECFIEITQPKQQQRVRLAPLQLEELAADG